VMVAMLRMWTQHNAHETVLAHALRLRGADVSVLTCGGGQPVCEVGWGRRKAPRPCDRCGWQTDQLAELSGYQVVRLADHLPWGSSPTAAPISTPPNVSQAAQRTAWMSAAWLAKSSDPALIERGRDAMADFEVASDGVRAAIESIFDAVQPEIIVLLNGLFASERAISEVAESRGIAVVTHEIPPRSGCILFGRSAPAPDMDTDALWESVRDLPLTEAEGAALDLMIHGRVSGDAAHERYFEKQTESDSAVRRAIGASDGQPVLAAFTNLAWDTAVLGKDIGFESMFSWLKEFAVAAGLRQDAIAVIRVHPAEERWGTAQPVVDELASLVGELPPNVRVVGPGEPLSSYTLMTIAERVFTYTTTVGLEAALRGTPVAVAGKTHYRGRGFTNDVRDADDLRETVMSAHGGRLSDSQLDLARRYAFAFFFQLMIPFSPVRLDGRRIAHVPTHASSIQPGADARLDVICERLLAGGDILLPREIAL
jgi:Capsule polysaccharide biosynthesis protein